MALAQGVSPTSFVISAVKFVLSDVLLITFFMSLMTIP